MVLDIGAAVAITGTMFAIAFGVIGAVWTWKRPSEAVLTLSEELQQSKAQMEQARRLITEADKQVEDERRKSMWSAINRIDAIVEKQDRRIDLLETNALEMKNMMERILQLIEGKGPVFAGMQKREEK